MEKARTVAVIGLGSTNMLSAVGDPARGSLEAGQCEPTEPTNLIAQVSAAISRVSDHADAPIECVGISAPGLVEEGVIRSFDTPGGEVIERIDLGAAIANMLDRPVLVQNDCTAAALAEWYYGDLGDPGCVVHVTFGTGIGAGIVVDGIPIEGGSKQAGEVGLLSLDPTRELSSMGIPGAWEAFCSGRGIPQHARYKLERSASPSELRDLDELSAQSIFAAASDGDEFASELLGCIGRYNAAGIGAIANTVNPDIVTIGGGVALNNRDRLLGDLHRHLSTYCFVDIPDVRITKLGTEIGLYGALAGWRAEMTAMTVDPEPVRARTSE